ncbi:MAG TPA: hydroxymethylbilane synthase [Gemmatimonadales bacterium]|nr:hydroxymethylbilane synthase [Gemmatimonadales bacterium]
MTGSLRIGTRASRLARWQTDRIAALLHASGVTTQAVEIRTTGDLVGDVPLPRIGDRALFTRQLDEALLDERIDLAVHSLKDLPTRLPDGVVLAAIGERADPRDALVARDSAALAALPTGAVVATSSLRRRAQLLRARPDLSVPDLRGNVETRLGKLDQNADWSAIVLASAGLDRLGLGQRISQRLPIELMLPAPGQGALAVTTRRDDTHTSQLLRTLVQRPDVAAAVTAERSFLGALEGGCHAPIAAFASTEGGTLRLHGRVLSLDGRDCLDEIEEGSIAGDGPARAGLQLAERLIRQGAEQLLGDARTQPGGIA